MNEILYDKEFKAIDYSQNLPKHDFEECTFINCNFSKANIRTISFTECDFIQCDFSNAKLDDTAFKEIQFTNCKLLGLRFDSCNPFLLSFNFTNCALDFSSFYQLKIEKTKFVNCKLNEVDFVETNLANSTFDNCDLNRTVFENTNLIKVDFRTSYNFDINPEINQLTKAKFSKENISGLLLKYNIDIE